jgi:MFS family permease
VLALLLATYTFNFIDRSIINIIGQAIKVDLKLTDTQLGLLGGFYFAILYTLLGIPIARIAERTNRVSVISVSLVIWSAFTALCGTAGSFATLAAYRFGVGFGEAGGSPPSHSLISDYFPPKQRATALSIYSVGIPLGGMIAAVAGGWQMPDWLLPAGATSPPAPAPAPGYAKPAPESASTAHRSGNLYLSRQSCRNHSSSQFPQSHS